MTEQEARMQMRKWQIDYGDTFTPEFTAAFGNFWRCVVQLGNANGGEFANYMEIMERRVNKFVYGEDVVY